MIITGRGTVKGVVIITITGTVKGTVRTTVKGSAVNMYSSSILWVQ